MTLANKAWIEEKKLLKYLTKFENHSPLISSKSPAVSSLIPLNNLSFEPPLCGSYIGEVKAFFFSSHAL